MNREAYLEAAAAGLRDFFPSPEAVPAVRVSVGFPSRLAISRRKRRIGECWGSDASTDGTPQIFISPLLVEPVLVGGTLLHELVHAVVGVGAGHKGPFSRLAKQVGLRKPWTSTTPNEECSARLNALFTKLGQYPHRGLKATAKERPGSRLCLLECDCGLKLRVAAQTYETARPIFHGDLRCEFELQAGGEE